MERESDQNEPNQEWMDGGGGDYPGVEEDREIQSRRSKPRVANGIRVALPEDGVDVDDERWVIYAEHSR